MTIAALSAVFLGTGIAVGFMAQRSRMCFVAGLRDWILVRDRELLAGLLSFVATVWVLTSVLGAFHLLHTGAPQYGAQGGTGPAARAVTREVGDEDLVAYLARQAAATRSSPEAGAAASVRTSISALPPLRTLLNTFLLVSLAGGFLVGALSVAAGGCVMRQHVLAAQGDRNAWFYLAGFYGAVIVHDTLLYRLLDWVYR